jgi:hypothetical protein
MDDRVFDSALLQMIQKLVADNMAIADHTMGVLQVSDIEIAHAPKKDLSGPLGVIKGPKGLFQRNGPTPMQK